MDNKQDHSENLQVRLDHLENDIKLLNTTIGQINAPVTLGPRTFSVNHSQIVKIKKPLPKKGRGKDTNQDEPVVDELRNIHKTLSKGTSAVQKIASLTELTSLSFLSWNSLVQPPVHPNEGNALVYLPKGSLSEHCLVVRDARVQKDFEKERAAKIDLLAENEILKGKLDQAKKETLHASQVKKRLKEEKLRREAAEALAAEYKIEVSRLVDHPYQKELASLQEEMKKRSDEVQMYKRSLENMEGSLDGYKRQVDDLLESKRTALAMVEEYRDRYERIHATKNSTAACVRSLQEKNIGLTRKLRDLEKDQVFLQNELSRVRNDQKEKDSECQRELQNLVEHFKDRAEKAERDLLNKFKECNELKLKSPFSDPEVIDLMDKQAKVIFELTSELKNKEAELTAKIDGLEKEMNETAEKNENKLRELNTKLNELTLKLSEKEDVLFESERLHQQQDKEISELQSRLSESSSTTRHQEALIKSLNETLAANSSHFETLSKEIDHLKKDNEKLDEEHKRLMREYQTKECSLINIQKKLEMEEDKVKVKDKMLDDQASTIMTLRSSLNETRAIIGEERGTADKLIVQIQKLESQKRELVHENEDLQRSLDEMLQRREETDKQNQLLKQLETQVYEKRKEWEKQLQEMFREKEQAVQTAKFATQKLVEAVKNYELQIEYHKKLNSALNGVLNEKELQLLNAHQQMEELNTEVWKSAKISQQVRDSLMSNTKQSCQVTVGTVNTNCRKVV